MKDPAITSQPQVDFWGSLDRYERRAIVRELRHIGLSYGEIVDATHAPKSTVRLWCHDIVLTDEQRLEIETRCGSESRAGTSVDTQWRRRREVAEIKAAAANYAEAHVGDPLFIAGTCLYWAEGSKTKNDLSITNSDPRILATFIRFVRTHLDPDASFALALSIHEIANETRAKQFWRDELELSATRFTRTHVKRSGSGHRTKRLPYGICRVRVDKGSDHWHRLMTFIEAIGDDPGW